MLACSDWELARSPSAPHADARTMLQDWLTCRQQLPVTRWKHQRGNACQCDNRRTAGLRPPAEWPSAASRPWFLQRTSGALASPGECRYRTTLRCRTGAKACWPFYGQHGAGAIGQHLRALREMDVPVGFTGRAGAPGRAHAREPPRPWGRCLAGPRRRRGPDRPAPSPRVGPRVGRARCWRRRFAGWLPVTAAGLRTARRLAHRGRFARRCRFVHRPPLRRRAVRRRRLAASAGARPGAGRFGVAVTALRCAVAILRQNGGRCGRGAVRRVVVRLAGPVCPRWRWWGHTHPSPRHGVVPWVA